MDRAEPGGPSRRLDWRVVAQAPSVSRDRLLLGWSGRLVMASLAILLGPSAFADAWYEHYAKGEEAIQAQNWTEAIHQFTLAIEQKPDPEAQVRTYGINVINYYPYLRLGIAYYNVGRLESASQAFDSEESYGAILRTAEDLKNLRTFRRLAEEAKQTSEKNRIAGIVAKSLAEARDLEAKGMLYNAMAALGKALSVDPKDKEALAAMQQLRDRVAAEENARDLEDRFSNTLFEGKYLLTSARYEKAASVLHQALSLKPDNPEAKLLLDEAQARLGDEIRARRMEPLGGRLPDILAEITRLEKEGQFAQALEKLQWVLALDRRNPQALALLDRLIQAQVGEQARTSRAKEVARLLGEGGGLLRSGQYEKALVPLNLAIALDSTNTSARKLLTQVFTAMKEGVLAQQEPSSLPKIPPSIALANVPNALSRAGDPVKTGTPEERVFSPNFLLAGLIVDDQPEIKVTYLREPVSGGPGKPANTQEATLQGEKIGNLYRYYFARAYELEPGAVALKIIASDPDGLTAVAIHRVRYLRPLYRNPWLYSGIALMGLSTAGALQGFRMRRRNVLLKRRFNPYVAGAPVLADDLFVGREALLSRVLQTIHNNSILLYGERRIGKTSLQHHLKKRLQQVKDPDYDFYPVYIDLQGTPQERFFATLAEDIFHELAPLMNWARPRLGLTEGSPYTHQAFVQDIRQLLKALQKRSLKKAKLVLLIDEVDELNAYDPKINQKLRSLFMKSFAEDLVAVVSGVGIKKQWDREGSPWYNFFEEIEVKPFTREDARELIERPIRGIFRLENGVVDRIIAATGCKPYLIQKLCIALVTRLHEEKRRKISVADVEAVGTPVAE